MSDQNKDIDKWIRQQLSRQRDVRLERFVLRSAQIGTKGSEVETFPVPDEISVDNVGLFVDEIMARAQTDADVIGKLVRYNLIACEVGRKDGSRFSFRLRGEADDDDSEGDEAPTEKGLIGQLMRHNEALMRMAVMTMGTTNTMLARRVEQSEQANERLVDERSQYFRAMEESKSLQHERDVSMLLASGQEERKNEALKKLESLLPVVVNKIAGREVLPEGQTGDIFGTLANSLSPDQLQHIAPYLTQEQQLMLLTLIKAAREKHSIPNGS